MYSTVLLAYDGSREGRLALREGRNSPRRAEPGSCFLPSCPPPDVFGGDASAVYVAPDRTDEVRDILEVGDSRRSRSPRSSGERRRSGRATQVRPLMVVDPTSGVRRFRPTKLIPAHSDRCGRGFLVCGISDGFRGNGSYASFRTANHIVVTSFDPGLPLVRAGVFLSTQVLRNACAGESGRRHGPAPALPRGAAAGGRERSSRHRQAPYGKGKVERHRLRSARDHRPSPQRVREPRAVEGGNRCPTGRPSFMG